MSSRNTIPMAILRAVMLASALCGVLVLMPTAEAQTNCPGGDYPPSDQTLTVDKTEVRPGESLTVSGSGYMPGTMVTISMKREDGTGARVLGTFTVGADGTFSGTVTIPADTAPGNYVLEASGTGCNNQVRVLNARVTVLGARAVAGAPRTGVEVAAYLGTAAMLLIVGTILVTMSRRRRLSR